MTWRRSSLPGVLTLTAIVVAGCGGGEKPAAAPAAKATKITITPTGDARADPKTYLAKLCPKPIGGELNFMVWEGYTDTLFTRPFEEACGVKVNATYMGSSDDLVAKLRAGGAETIDLISPSSDAATAVRAVRWPASAERTGTSTRVRSRSGGWRPTWNRKSWPVELS